MTAQSCEGTALITAAAGRIGRAIANRLGSRWALVLQENGEFFAEAEELAKRLRAAGGHAAVLDADLRDVEATGRLVERAAAVAKGPVILLVNAATLFGTDCGSFAAPSWDDHFAINLRAPCLLADGFAAALPTEACGAIVNLVDRRLWQNEPSARTYELSQAALWCATETMARGYAPRIRVNAVGPPKAIASSMAAGTTRRGMPLAGLAAPDTIAKAVHYLATAVAVSGQMIAIDPGETIPRAGAP